MASPTLGISFVEPSAGIAHVSTRELSRWRAPEANVQLLIVLDAFALDKDERCPAVDAEVVGEFIASISERTTFCLLLSSSDVFSPVHANRTAEDVPDGTTERAVWFQRVETAVRALPCPHAILRLPQVITDDDALICEWRATLKTHPRFMGARCDRALSPLSLTVASEAARALLTSQRVGLHHICPTRAVTDAELLRRLAVNLGQAELAVLPSSSRPGETMVPPTRHPALRTSSSLLDAGLEIPDPLEILDAMGNAG